MVFSYVGGQHLIDDFRYQAEAFGFTQKIYKIGLEQYERRQEELKLYNSCIDSERKKAQKLGQE